MLEGGCLFETGDSIEDLRYETHHRVGLRNISLTHQLDSCYINFGINGKKVDICCKAVHYQGVLFIRFYHKLVFSKKKIAAIPCWSNLSQNQQFKDLIIPMNRVNLICKDITGFITVFFWSDLQRYNWFGTT